MRGDERLWRVHIGRQRLNVEMKGSDMARIYIRCIFDIYGREITEYTVIYGVYIRFWPTL